MPTTPARWFKPAAIVIVVWMLLGAVIFVMDILTTPEQAAALPEMQRVLRDERPLWLMIVFGLATSAGLLGSGALLMRKSMAVKLLTLSLAAVTLQTCYTVVVMKTVERFGASHALVLPSIIFFMGALSLWVAIKAANQDWLA